MLTRQEIYDVDPQFRHLADFVDRTLELDKFQEVAGIPPRERPCSFLAFYGSKGMGKSWLIYRIDFECKRRNVAVARLDLDNDRFSDAARIMQAVVTQLGNENFPDWTGVKREWETEIPTGIAADLRGDADTPSSSSLNVTGARDVKFEKDAVAGNKFEIHQYYSGERKTSAQQNPDEYKYALTESFLRDLGDMLQQKPVVFLLDNFDSECITNQTRKWIMENLLDRPRSARGQGVLVVLTASRELDSEIYLDVLQADTEFDEIHPFGREHIIEYLKAQYVKLKDASEIKVDEIETIVRDTQGIPKRVFEEIALYLRKEARRKKEDELRKKGMS
jgi:hypothetical protein